MITIDLHSFVDTVMSILKPLVYDLFLPIVKGLLESTPPEIPILLAVLGLMSALFKIVRR